MATKKRTYFCGLISDFKAKFINMGPNDRKNTMVKGWVGKGLSGSRYHGNQSVVIATKKEIYVDKFQISRLKASPLGLING